jgi:hypothetical protein
LMAENLSSVCSICVFHPSRQIVFGGNSSGRVHVFMWISYSLFIKHMARIESNTPNCFRHPMKMEFYCFTPCYFLFFGLISLSGSHNLKWPNWCLNFRAWIMKKVLFKQKKIHLWHKRHFVENERRLLHVLKIQFPCSLNIQN